MSLGGVDVKSGLLAGSLMLGVTFTGLGLLYVFSEPMGGGSSKTAEYIKLKPVLVPMKRKGTNKNGYVFTAVYLKTNNSKNIRKACRLEPRIQDVLIRHFQRNPIRKAHYKNIDGAKTRFLSTLDGEKRLLKSIKRVAGDKLIEGVKLMKDFRSSKKSNSSNFPLPYIACASATRKKLTSMNEN
jgi:hypothetical protein